MSARPGTPEQIAAGLTAAQRRALLWLRPGGRWAKHCKGEDDAPSIHVLHALSRLGLATRSVTDKRGWRTTDHLGAQVRAILAQQEQPHDR